MVDDFLIRLVELFKEDKELHEALVSLINDKADSERALAEYRRERTAQMRGS